MTEITKTPGTLEIFDRMPPLKRIILLLISLFPLLAPYELLLRPRWDHYLNFIFLFFTIISLGALAVSGFFLWGAIAGIDARMRFNNIRHTFTFFASAPVMPARVFKYPLDDIKELSVETHDWSEGSPSYSFCVLTTDGRDYSIGNSWSLAEVEALKKEVELYLGRADHKA